jgi:hypothetical protein
MNSIYSLVSIDKESKDEYIQAISYNKNILQNFLVTVKPHYEQLAEFVIKDTTKIYKIYFNDDLGKMVLMSSKYKKDSSKLYAFNKITTKGCENVLLDLSDVKYEEIKDILPFKNDISMNEILFDTYYDEGIMNA